MSNGYDLACKEPDYVALCREALHGNPNLCASYRNGEGVLGALVGKVMVASRGAANPRLVRDELLRQLNAL